MTENLRLPLSANNDYTRPITVEVASNTSATYIENWTPTGTNANNGAEALNNNTKYDSTIDQYYYSWYAATSGSGGYEDVNTDASLSICPSAWRLPANYTIEEWKTYSYSQLLGAYFGDAYINNVSTGQINNLEKFPLYFSRVGDYVNGGLAHNGYAAVYWSSSTWTGDHRSYMFHYIPTLTAPQYYGYKYTGYIVRCVAL